MNHKLQKLCLRPSHLHLTYLRHIFSSFYKMNVDHNPKLVCKFIYVIIFSSCNFGAPLCCFHKEFCNFFFILCIWSLFFVWIDFNVFFVLNLCFNIHIFSESCRMYEMHVTVALFWLSFRLYEAELLINWPRRRLRVYGTLDLFHPTAELYPNSQF